MADNGFAEWGGYMEAKITKLEEQYNAASAPFRKSQLFAGISIYVNGMTNPTADELKRIMMVHGGTFHHYESTHTTYIIASNLPDVKVRNMDTSKIISAKWVVDCVAAKRILDYTQYLLYTNQKTTQPRLVFTNPKKEENGQPIKKAKLEEVSAIMQDLNKLNAQMRESNNSVKKVNDPPDVMGEAKIKSSSTSGGHTTTARTAVDPNFLPEFFNNSRLHHIATLGAGFKQYVSELREKHDENLGFPAREKLRELWIAENAQSNEDFANNDCKYIMHIDMDCFFVSVGLRKHPHLRGQPVAVTHSKGGAAASDVPVHPDANREMEMELFAKRFEQHLHNNILSDKVRNGFDAKMSLSEIASCSYEARAKGIRNGMFVGHAIKLCPELKTIPYDFEGYKEVAFTLYDIIAQYTLQIEAVSCDEMFVDLTDVLRDLQMPPMQFVRAIRAEVKEKTGCPCSAGVGGNKLQARMATKEGKPDGQYHLEAASVESYMANILAEDLPGVGSSTNYTLKEAGYITCGHLQQLTLAKLQQLIGKKHGETLYQFCRGIDNRPLAYEQARKSVSAEVNYGIRFKEYSELETFLKQLCVEVHSRLLQIKRKTKCITLKLMVRAKDAPVETSKFMGHGVCDHITKSVALQEFTNDLEVITRSILSTMRSLHLPPHELRGIGIQLTKMDQAKEVPKEPKENLIRNMFSKMVKKQAETTATTTTTTAATSQTATQEKVKEKIKEETKKADDSSKNLQEKKPPNVLGMLQKAHAKKQQKVQTTNDGTSSNLPSYIDPEVFAELPEEIREEILNEMASSKIAQTNEKSMGSFSNSPSNDSVVSELNVMPSTSRAAQLERERRQLERLQGCKTIECNNNNNNKQELNNNQVDEDFLKALPPSLRKEIEEDLRQFHGNKENKQTKVLEATSTTLTTKSKSPMPTSSLPTISALSSSSSSSSSEQNLDETNVFLQPNCNQLLLQWLKSHYIPKDYDTVLCCDHARAMVRANRLSDLYGSLIYFRKIIKQKESICDGDAWLGAYKNIISAVNEELNLIMPNRSLLTYDTKVSCDN